MSTTRSGDILQLIIGGREMDPAPDSNVTYRVTDSTNEVSLTGNRRVHTTHRLRPVGFESLPISVDPEKGDAEYIAQWATEGDARPCSMTLANGQTYGGELVCQDAPDPNTGDGQLEITAMGARFEQL